MLLRIEAGLGIIATGLFLIGGVVGWIVLAIGLVPLAAGVFDFCILSPLFRGPFSGRQIKGAEAVLKGVKGYRVDFERLFY